MKTIASTAEKIIMKALENVAKQAYSESRAVIFKPFPSKKIGALSKEEATALVTHVTYFCQKKLLPKMSELRGRKKDAAKIGEIAGTIYYHV